MRLARLHTLLFPPKKYPDDFIARLRVAVAGEGMLQEGNVWAFDHAVRHLPPEGDVLEIGAFGGMSTNIIAYLLRKHGQPQRRLFTCDPWIYEGFHDAARAKDTHYLQMMDGSSAITRAQYLAFVRDSFERTTRFFSAEHLPHPFCLTSDAFFEKWKATDPAAIDIFGNAAPLGGALAFCYVDGNHAYDYAQRDVENALQWLVPGGFLLLDDSGDHLTYGSAKLAKALCQRAGLKLVMKNPNYLFAKT